MIIRPIIFSAPMVRALLEGRKTQTRRGLKPKRGTTIADCVDAGPSGIGRRLEVPLDKLVVPYAPGDLLYVRESHYVWGSGNKDRSDLCINYRATEPDAPCTWTPSIHMPRWASRLTLKVTDVRVQRLRDISRNDSIAEGATVRPACYGYKLQEDGWSMNWDRPGLTNSLVAMLNPQGAFLNYWNLLHGQDAAAQNPWVVAVTFDVHKVNVDHFAERRKVEAT